MSWDGEERRNGLHIWSPAFWTQRGVIPRWQMGLAFLFVVAAFAYGLATTRQAADSAQQAVAALQRSRIEICEDTNARRDGAIRVLDARTRRLPPRQRARAQRTRAFTVALIAAIVPHRDCRRALRPR